VKFSSSAGVLRSHCRWRRVRKTWTAFCQHAGQLASMRCMHSFFADETYCAQLYNDLDHVTTC